MERKLRKIGDCLMISIPTKVCELFNFAEGDILDISPLGICSLKIEKK